MKIFFLCALAAFSTTTALAEEFELACVTETPTTTFVIRTEGELLKARLILHHGPEFAPAINGVFTPRDLPILSDRANLARKLLSDTTFTWPRKNCRFRDDVRFECFGTDESSAGVGGVKIRPFALYTSRIKEETIAGTHNYVSLRMSFDVDGKGDPSVEMKYDSVGCFDPRKHPGRFESLGL